jgi:hypothetical protein
MCTAPEAEWVFCSDLPGQCCSSCHHDDDEGHGDLNEAWSEDGSVVVTYCCTKAIAAYVRVGRPPKETDT